MVNDAAEGSRHTVVACVQMEPRIGDKDHNVASSMHYLEQAAARGAKLVVLP